MKALRDFGFGEVGLTAADSLQHDRVIQLGFEPGRIGLLSSIPGVTWEEVEAGSVRRDINGVAAVVIGRRELIESKRSAGRPEDAADVHRLGGVLPEA